MKRILPALLCLLLCACTRAQQPAAVPTDAPKLAEQDVVTLETPSPSPTPQPTPSPSPTPSPAPTPSPTPTPEPTPELITDDMLDSCMFDSYFDDALFVGDSLTATFSHYVRNVRNDGTPDYLGKAQFLGSYSMSTKRAADNRVIENGVNFELRGRNVTLTDGISMTGAKKVFLLLGLNDLCVRDWDEVLGYFAKIIDRVHADCPDVQLIIEAELPVRKAFYDKTPPWNEFNIGLKALCDEKDVTFLDFTAPLTDENGELIKAYCGDGKCHLNIAGEEIWVRALRRFAVEQTHIGGFVFEPIH